MSETGTIVNKVAKSGLITIDLEKLFNPTSKIVGFDIKPFLFMELLLKENNFREAMDAYDFSVFSGSILAVYCSSDAIIPEWAWMLVTSKAATYSAEVHFGTITSVKERLMFASAERHDWSQYANKKVLVKGCGDEPIPSSLYVYATSKLMAFADRVMYGEACSFVPVWRKSQV
jgi:hypothetical protein